MKKGICTYCGKLGELTQDHIPPKALYPKAIRNKISKFHTVDSCFHCNNEGKISDEVAKVFCGLITGHRYDCIDAVVDSIAGTLLKNNKLQNAVFEAKTAAEKVGLEGSIKISSTDANFLRNTFGRVAKAFYYEKTRIIFPSTSEIIVRFHPEFSKDQFSLICESFSPVPIKEVNDGTFKYKIYIDSEGQLYSLMALFDELFILVSSKSRVCDM